MADRPTELVEALARVVARDGWDGATVAAIAREAGLAPGLVHYYFPRKLDLLLALIERLEVTLDARIRARLRGRRGAARVGALIDACLATGDDADPDAVRCFVAIGAQAARDPEVAARWRASLDHLREAIVRAGVAEPAAAAGLLAAILGCWELGVVHPGALPPGSAAATVRAMARSVRP